MVSNPTHSEMFADHADEGLLVILTLDHPDFISPIRVVNNTVDITSRGNAFIAFPFEIELPSMDDSSSLRSLLRIDNVSLEITQMLRTVQSAPSLLIEVVRTDNFDAVEISFPQLSLRNARWNVSTVTFEVTSDDSALEQYPADTFSPSFFPGIF